MYYDSKDIPVYDSFMHRQFRGLDQPARIIFYAPNEEGKEQFVGSVIMRPTRLSTSHDPNSSDGSPSEMREKLRLGHLGKTLIRFPEGSGDDLIGQMPNGESYFLLGSESHTIVKGKRHSVVAVEYRQQSRIAGTCGHTAVQSAASYLHRRLRTAELTEEGIYRIARERGSGEILDDLTDGQIAEVLAETGCSVRVYSSIDGFASTSYRGFRPIGAHELTHLVHLAVDSALPSILILDPEKNEIENKVSATESRGLRHAVLAVGHTAIKGKGFHRLVPDKDKHFTVDEPLLEGGFRTTTAWARDIIVHDDANGPYRRLPIRSSGDGAATDERARARPRRPFRQRSNSGRRPRVLFHAVEDRPCRRAAVVRDTGALGGPVVRGQSPSANGD